MVPQALCGPLLFTIVHGDRVLEKLPISDDSPTPNVSSVLSPQHESFQRAWWFEPGHWHLYLINGGAFPNKGIHTSPPPWWHPPHPNTPPFSSHSKAWATPNVNDVSLAIVHGWPHLNGWLVPSPAPLQWPPFSDWHVLSIPPPTRQGSLSGARSSLARLRILEPGFRCNTGDGRRVQKEVCTFAGQYKGGPWQSSKSIYDQNLHSDTGLLSLLVSLIRQGEYVVMWYSFGITTRLCQNQLHQQITK